jgi:phosphatidylglycerophosphate synthase
MVLSVALVCMWPVPQLRALAASVDRGGSGQGAMELHNAYIGKRMGKSLHASLPHAMAPSVMHRYECSDRSVLARLITRFLAPVVDRWIPARFSANHVTLMGAIAAWLMGAGIICSPNAWRIMLAPLWTALLWTYCILDHVDGYRARKRGAVSGWGEFIDHGADSMIVSFVVAVFLLFGTGETVEPRIGFFFFATIALATIAIWAEQYATGKLRLPLLGPVEAVLLAGLYMLSWCSPIIGSVWQRQTGLGLNTIETALVMTGLACLWFGWRKAADPRTRQWIAPFVSISLLLGGVVLMRPSFMGLASVLLGLQLAIYSARLIWAHLGHVAPSWRFWLAVMMCNIAVVGPADHQGHPQGWLWIFPCFSAWWLCKTWLRVWQKLCYEKNAVRTVENQDACRI